MPKFYSFIIAGFFILAVAGIMGVFILHHASGINEEFKKLYEELRVEAKNQEVPQEESHSPNAVNVPILIFHSVIPHYARETKFQNDFDITPEELENILKLLQDKGFTAISYGDLADHLQKGTALPPKPVILSFDDGWKSHYVYALPLLKKYHDTATFFIYTIVMGHHRFMTWDEVRELDRAGMQIGGHTKTHAYLPGIHNAEVLKEEIEGGKKIIEKKIGHPITTFAYPFGHYTDAAIAAVKEAGFRTARTTFRGTHHSDKDLYILKGIMISNNYHEITHWL